MNQKSLMRKKTVALAFHDTIPVFAGYIVLGIGFGVMLRVNGYGVIWAFFMSIFMYAGAMQYAAVGILASGASVASTAVATVLINIRHIFYGISLLQKYKGLGIQKLYMIFALTDETYALVSGHDTPEHVSRKMYYFLVSLFDHCYWILGCCLGAILGSVLKINFEGIDFALTALFVSILIDQWLSTKNHVPVLIGMISTAVCLAVFGSENFLIPSMIVIVLILTLTKKKIKMTPEMEEEQKKRDEEFRAKVEERVQRVMELDEDADHLKAEAAFEKDAYVSKTEAASEKERNIEKKTDSIKEAMVEMGKEEFDV